VIGAQIYPISSSAMTLGYANTTSVTVGSTSAQNPVNLNGPTYFTNNNIQTTRSDPASFGGTQISWNRSGGGGETNIISYQGPGGNGGIDLANVNSAGTYISMIRARFNAFSCDVGAYFNGGVAYGKGNITTPSYTQSGQYTNNTFIIGSNSYFSTIITFPIAFSSTPAVFVTNGSIENTTCSRLVMGATSLSTTQFTMTFYNNAGAGGTSGLCVGRWMAHGGW